MQTPECGWTRIVVEKPFGRDLATYQELQHALSNCFDESILYRIDHYLAKTMVEQIIPLRQKNLWKKRVSSVYIVWKETHSLKTRGGGYFDHYGIVRDVVQNHLLQLLTLIAMELNDVVDVSIHERKCKVLEQTRVVGPALFGQYQGYGNDVGNAKSATPTYALVRLQVNTPQWNGVPFIIEAGKALHESVCEIRLQLDSPGCVEVVVLRVQPNPAIIYYYDRYVNHSRFCSDGRGNDSYERVTLMVYDSWFSLAHCSLIVYPEQESRRCWSGASRVQARSFRFL
jgi:glucose-6-phosphate 1-dehydrogenase